MAIMMMMTSRADNLFLRLACAPKYATTPREASNALVKRVMSRSMHWLKLIKINNTKLMKTYMELIVYSIFALYQDTENIRSV